MIYGGSLHAPVVKDADVYIGFDAGSMRFTERSWPWKQGDEFLFKIKDMSVPGEARGVQEAGRLDAKAQLEAGKKVHCGCIGGHGRTGTFLAALVSEFGEKDAISYVRKNYCQKAVESSSQVKFLASTSGSRRSTGYKSSSGSSHSQARRLVEGLQAKGGVSELSTDGSMRGTGASGSS